MPEPAVGVKLRRGSLPRHAPALDDGVAVGELHQALDVLVDHEDRLPGGAQAPEAVPDLLAHERREAFGRLVENQEMGLVTSARPMASICCSPPESWFPMFSARSASRGKRSKTCPASTDRAAGAVLGEGDEVLAHAQVGKICRPSGTSAIPMRAMRSGASRSMRRPRKLTARARG